MIHTGDCLEVMRTLPEASVDAVVTDPPYGLEFMGKEWDAFNGGQQGRWKGRKQEAGRFDTDGLGAADLGKRLSARPSHGADSRGTKCLNCGHYKFSGTPCKCLEPRWEIRTGTPPNMAAYQQWCEAWGLEALRVTVPGGYLLAFGGTRTHHRLVCGLEDAGWIIRDELTWVYASGFPKGRANLKPAHEPIVLARKPGPLRHLEIDRCRIPSSSQDRDGSLASTTAVNVGRRSTTTERELWSEPSATELAATPAGASATSIVTSKAAIGCSDGTMGDGSDTSGSTASDGRKPTGQSRRATSSTTETETDSTIGSLTSNASAAPSTTGGISQSESRKPDDAEQRSDSTGPPFSPDSVSGRWPSNLLLTSPVFDGDVDGVVGGGTVTTTNPGTMRNEANGTGGWGSIQSRQPGTMLSVGDSGTYSRFFLIPKADRADREPVLRGQLPLSENVDWPQEMDPGASRGAAPRENAHPTVKPIELMRHLVRLVTPSGGTVLDPFLGSGTTAIACEMEGFAWLGVEKEIEYVRIAEARLNGVQRGLGLDVPAPTRKRSESSGKASGYDWDESVNDNPTRITRNIKSGVHYGDGPKRPQKESRVEAPTAAVWPEDAS